MISKNKSKIFVVSAPSGCGKTTLCNAVLKKMPRLLHSVSVTTRLPRRGEKEGIDYYFISSKQFKDWVKKKKFIEYAKVFDNFYGTPISPLKKALEGNKDMLLSIDVQGAMQVKKIFGKKAIAIFILPPSMEALRSRLLKRHADSRREIKKRLKKAKKEISFLPRYDYAIVNNKIKDAVAQLEAIITAENKKQKR